MCYFYIVNLPYLRSFWLPSNRTGDLIGQEDAFADCDTRLADEIRSHSAYWTLRAHHSGLFFL